MSAMDFNYKIMCGLTVIYVQILEFSILDFVYTYFLFKNK